MKRVYLLVAVCFLATLGYAERVTETDAAQAANNFFEMKSSASKPILRRVKSQSQTEMPSFYVYQNEGGEGWVMIAADDRVMPVLAYSRTGKFDLDNIPVNAKEWFARYDSEIRFAQQENLQADEQVRSQWSDLRQKRLTVSTATEVVSALVTTTWDQAPYYNQACPNDSYLTGNPYYGHPVTGCVATAMAQVMKYWEWPEKGTGSRTYSYTNKEYKDAGYKRNWPYGDITASFGTTTYDWNNMPKALDASSSSTQVKAVSTLMFHCGVACKMMYGEESGAVVTDAGNGMIDYFSYSNEMKEGGYNWAGYNVSDYEDLYYKADWIKILKDELDARRPIIYSGGVHCFVCDGYDSDDKFHFNWGWGGLDDGFYALTSLRPSTQYGIGGGDYDFTSNQYALFNIRPNDPTVLPAADREKFDIQMNAAISMEKDSVLYKKGEISVKANISNDGIADFNGNFACYLYSADSTIVRKINTITITDNTLPAGYYFETDYIKYTPTEDLYPGNYFIAFVYRPNGKTEKAVGSKNYAAKKDFVIYQKADLEMYSNISLYSGSWYKDETAQILVEVTNEGAADFDGELRLSILSADGTKTEIGVQQLTGENKIPVGWGGRVTFTITWAQTGQFSLIAEFRHTGETDWNLVGCTNFSSICPIVIEEYVKPTVIPDPYEENDTEDMAYKLSVPMFGKSGIATAQTTDASIHIATDVDYYHLQLAPNYDYTISAYIIHAENSSAYSARAQVSYKIDKWSTPVSGRTEEAKLEDGGEYMVKVEPKGTEGVGSYQLQITVKRVLRTDGLEQSNVSMSLFPNPTSDYLTVQLPSEPTTVQILTVTGQIVRQTAGEGTVTLNVSGLPTGEYLLRAVSNNTVQTSKFIKQ